MRTIIFFLIAACVSFKGFSQDAAFTKAQLQNSNNEAVIVFSVAREVNVRHYRLEASNDSVTFEVIATIPAKGNSMLPLNYTVDVQPGAYTYYRIGKAGMDATMPYSAVMTNRTALPPQDYKPGEMPAALTTDMAVTR